MFLMLDSANKYSVKIHRKTYPPSAGAVLPIVVVVLPNDPKPEVHKKENTIYEKLLVMLTQLNFKHVSFNLVTTT